MNELIRTMRTMKLKDIIKKINQILVGYYHYYGITDNSMAIKRFRYAVIKELFYWLNRRSQRRSYTWEGFLGMIDKEYPIADAKIYVSIYA